jgi:hypothetical protein
VKYEARKCSHLYFYYEHARFGFMQLRLQTWFPFQMNLCLNGRHWLARQLDRAGNRGDFVLNGLRNRDLCRATITALLAARKADVQQLTKIAA